MAKRRKTGRTGSGRVHVRPTRPTRKCRQDAASKASSTSEADSPSTALKEEEGTGTLKRGRSSSSDEEDDGRATPPADKPDSIDRSDNQEVELAVVEVDGFWEAPPYVEGLKAVDRSTLFTVDRVYLCWWGQEDRWYAVRVCEAGTSPWLRHLVPEGSDEETMFRDGYCPVSWYDLIGDRIMDSWGWVPWYACRHFDDEFAKKINVTCLHEAMADSARFHETHPQADNADVPTESLSANDVVGADVGTAQVAATLSSAEGSMAPPGLAPAASGGPGEQIYALLDATSSNSRL